MVLPKELEQRFDTAIAEYEEERKMRYVTSWERRGMEKGIQQGVQQGLVQGLKQGKHEGALEACREDLIDILRARFERLPPPLVTAIDDLEERYLLKELLKKAATVPSLEAFQHLPELQQQRQE